MTIKRLKSLFSCLLVIHLVVPALALALEPEGRKEFFPFTFWMMFAKTRGVQQDYAVEFLSSGGDWEWLPPQESPIQPAAARPATAAVQRLGRAIEGGDLLLIEQERARFEVFLSPAGKGTAYRVVARTWDPLEVWRSGKADSIRSLAAFGEVARDGG